MVRPINAEISSFTMGLHVLLEGSCNCTWFRYLFDSSTMSSMILSVKNNLKYDKVSWPWGVFSTGPVISLNGKSSIGLWNALSRRGSHLTERALLVLQEFCVALLLQGWFLSSLLSLSGQLHHWSKKQNFDHS